MDALGEQLAYSGHLLCGCKIAVLIDELTDVDRLANLYACSRTEAEEATVTDAHGYDVERHVGHKLLCLESDAEDTFSQG